MGVENTKITKNMVTISRLWNEPQIRISVDDVGIMVSTLLPDFLDALILELGIQEAERGAARAKLFEAAERVCAGMKAETAKAM